MWLTTVLILNTLTMLTTAHADRGRPTLKDDEHFRNGLVRDLKEKLKLFNAKCKTILYKKYCLNVSLNCTAKCYSKPVNLNFVVKTIQHERNTMNIDKDKLKRTGKYAEATIEINATWESLECIEVTLIFVICIIFAWIVFFGVNKVMENKLDVIQLVQQLIISLSVCIISLYAHLLSIVCLQMLPKFKRMLISDKLNPDLLCM